MLGCALFVVDPFVRLFDALRGGRPRLEPSEPNPGAAGLSAAELAAVERAVRALVDHDRPALEAMGAFDDGADIYLWTRDYGRWGTVDLLMPPGEPATWPIYIYRRNNGSCAVDVQMCTAQEGWSDLTLQLLLRAGGDAGVEVEMTGLRVL